MKLNDIRVSHRLWATVLGLLLLLLGVAGFTQYRAGAVVDEALTSVQDDENLISQAIEWRGLSVANNERALALLMIEDPAVVKFFLERRDAASKQITGLQQEIAAAVRSEPGKRAMALVGERRTAMTAVRAKSDQVKNHGDRAALSQYALKELDPASKAYIDALDDFVQVVGQQRDAEKAQAVQARQNVTQLGLLIAAVVVGLAIALATMLVRSITRPLDNAVAVARAISAGDLTQSLRSDRRDEFGQLLQALSEMTAKLRDVVGEVRHGVESVSTASTQIATGNQDLSGRTEQTAANLEETAASMEELTATVSQSADTARQANQLAAQAAQAAQRGGEVVEQVVGSMQNITDSSRKISDIIGVIDGIAFQTNILALNAAVEAARAGEQGRGFAVVAGEVRNLAQRSAEAAKEIKVLITASVATVETGSQQVAQAGQSMGEIVDSVRRVSDLIGEITASSTEQRDGIGQVNQAMANLDQMTQQNAALVEESSAAATAMRDQAMRLAEVVAVFNVDSGGVVRAAAPMRARAAVPSTRPAPAPRRVAAARPAPAARIAAAPAAATRPAATTVRDDDWESF